MRATQETNLPDTANVRRPDKATKNAAGGTTDTFMNAYTNQPCHSQARILREIQERDSGGQVQSGVRWIVRFAFGTVIKLDDELDITETVSGQTYTLRVTSHLSEESDGSAYGVQCIRVQ